MCASVSTATSKRCTGFAEWEANGPEVVIRDGVDSYLVENGRIRAQTIHYTAQSSRLSTTKR